MMYRNPHCWETKPTPNNRTPWSVAPEGGVVQGPLDLAFLAGTGMDLVLDEGQIALLSVRGELSRCLWPGFHPLDVGGQNGLPIESMLYFLHLDRTLSVPWHQYIPIRPATGFAPGPRLASGVFEVLVTYPTLFYDAFLRDRDGSGEDICLDTLTHLLPTFLAIRMTTTTPTVDENGAGPDSLAERAAQLPRNCLDEDISPYGLRCVTWSIANISEDEPAPVTPFA